MHRTVKLAIGSIAVGGLVLAMKLSAWWLTGSVALFSDAMESTVNIFAGVVAALALRVSAVPADANHPYGYTKAEYLSAVVEGVAVVVAALAILREAWFGILAPQPLEAPVEGLVVTAVASVVNGVWAALLMRRGRQWRAPALVADAKHLLADVLTSAGVIGGLVLVELTGWLILDPILAAAVALNILWVGWRVVREAVGGLMDESASPEILERVRAAIAATAKGAIEAHDIRTRHAGRRTFVEFHLIVPSPMTVHEAHEICDRVEDAIRRDIPDCTVTVHLEPAHKAKNAGVIVRH